MLRTHLHVERRKLYEHVKTAVPPEQLLIFDASAGDNLGKLAVFLNASVPDGLNLDVFPNLFDAKSLKTESTHAQIVKHNMVLIVAATWSLTLMLLVPLFIWAVLAYFSST